MFGTGKMAQQFRECPGLAEDPEFPAPITGGLLDTPSGTLKTHILVHMYINKT